MVSFNGKAQSKDLQGKLDTLNGWIYIDTISHISKVELCHRIIDLAKKEEDLEAECWALMNISVAYYRLNALRTSKEYIGRAQILVAKIENDLYRSRLALLMGNYYLERRNPDKALRVYETGMTYAKKLEIKNQALLLLSGIANMKVMLGESEEANEIYQDADKYLPYCDHEYYGSLYWATRSNIIAGLGVNLDSGIVYGYKSIEICQRINQVSHQVSVYSILGDIYRQKGDIDSSLYHWQIAEEMGIKHSLLREALIASKTRAELHKERGELEVAYEIIYNSLEKQDSSTRATSDLKFQELEDLFVARRNEDKIKLLKSENREATLRSVGLAVGLAFAILLIIVRIIYVRKKIKRTAYLNEIKEQLLQSELERKKIEEARLKETLVNKETNLKTFGIDISRKRELLQDILSRVKEVKKSTTDPTQSDALHDLTIFINSQLQIDSSVEEFKELVESVNSSFYNSLRKEFPNLSDQDLQICGLIRLNLTNKEIAAIRNVEIDSAKTSRYRIRKKLGLDPESDLQKYLSQF